MLMVEIYITNLNQDKVIKEGLKELGIKDFKSLFKKMPSDLQKRVYNSKELWTESR